MVLIKAGLPGAPEPHPAPHSTPAENIEAELSGSILGDEIPAQSGWLALQLPNRCN